MARDTLGDYHHILLSLDNSVHSRYAEDLGVILARPSLATITGLHVYSGHFHRKRFQALEEFLPEKYQQEETLEYQRKIHSVLIERGLEIISLEYMKRLREQCQLRGIPFKEKLADGKNSDVIVDQGKACDLVMMGAQGMGAVPGFSHLGSNTQRVLRSTKTDLMIVRNNRAFKNIAVAVDGSECSWAAFDRAIMLAKQHHSKLLLLTSFDPRLHPAVFHSLATVLSDEAGKVFKFKEQEQLHTMVIDTSLEDLYKGHLVKGAEFASTHGLQITTELLHGKPFSSLYERLNAGDIDLLVMGRTGMHHGRCETIGSNTERIAELAPINVLIVAGAAQEEQPQAVLKEPAHHEDTVQWSDEARKRLENIPGFARPMAVLAIERYAKENGIAVITPEAMRKARGQYES